MSTSPEFERGRGSPFSIIAAPRTARSGIPPTPLTPLIGRQAERARVIDLVRGDSRLLTLTGPGGVGKTRLALQLAVDLQDEFADGVAWIPLAAVRDAHLVVPSIAHVLGVQVLPSHNSLNALKAALRDTRLLLLLDNFEQVLPAAEQLVDLLGACPRLVILTTSRSLLRVSGEHIVRVPPLEVPDPDPEASLAPAHLIASEAVQLFVERARAIAPAFMLDGEDARLAATICRRLEGLPLAIELAAAWVSMLPLPALSARLARRLPMLTGGDRDQPDRLRTMRDAIAWSYDLLDPRERAVFRGLAVYAGGFRLAAVVSLCAQEAPEAPAQLDTLAGQSASDALSEASSEAFACIRTLADHSLVQQVVDPDGEPRFMMLETIREFALEQLHACGERETAEQARAGYLIELTGRHTSNRVAAERETSFALLDLEQANIRETLAWLIRIGAEGRAFQLAGVLASFWIAQGYYPQGRSWLEQLLAYRNRDGAADRAEAFVGLGLTLLFQGERDRSRVVLEDALDFCRASGASKHAALALVGLGVVAGMEARYEDAMGLLEEAVTLGQSLDDPSQVALVASSAHSPLGTIAHGLGKLSLARDHHLRSLAVRRDLGDTRGVSRALADLGNVAVDQGNHQQALEYIREALGLAAQYPTPPFVTHALVGLARISIARGQHERAARLLGTADALRGEIETTVTMEFEHRIRQLACDAARAPLSDERFANAYNEGRSQTLENVIADLDTIVRDTPDLDRGLPGSDPPAAVAAYGLTPREIEVLQGIVNYQTDREIAEHLFISPRTVGWHVTGVLTKLGVASRRQAAMKAIDENLL